MKNWTWLIAALMVFLMLAGVLAYVFLIRPRRFGKSLWIAILQAYYDVALKERFDSMF